MFTLTYHLVYVLRILEKKKIILNLINLYHDLSICCMSNRTTFQALIFVLILSLPFEMYGYMYL